MDELVQVSAELVGKLRDGSDVRGPLNFLRYARRVPVGPSEDLGIDAQNGWQVVGRVPVKAVLLEFESEGLGKVRPEDIVEELVDFFFVDDRGPELDQEMRDAVLLVLLVVLEAQAGHHLSVLRENSPQVLRDLGRPTPHSLQPRQQHIKLVEQLDLYQGRNQLLDIEDLQVAVPILLHLPEKVKRFLLALRRVRRRGKRIAGAGFEALLEISVLLLQRLQLCDAGCFQGLNLYAEQPVLLLHLHVFVQTFRQLLFDFKPVFPQFALQDLELGAQNLVATVQHLLPEWILLLALEKLHVIHRAILLNLERAHPIRPQLKCFTHA